MAKAVKARRDYGDGSIYQRKRDGRWTGELRLRDGTRKYVYAPKDENTKAAARLALKEAQRKYERGELVKANKQRVSDYLEYWLSVHKLTIREITYRQYVSMARVQIIPRLGTIPLQKLSSAHLQRFVSDLVNAGLASSYIHLIYDTLHAALKDALEWQMIGVDPAHGVKLPRKAQKEVQTLDPEQAQVLLEAVQGTPLYGMVTLALATGLRRGELLALKWSDIDLDHGTLQVARTDVYINGQGHVQSEPKTRSGKRSLKLASFAVQALHEHHAQQLAQQVAVGPATWQDLNLVFCNAHGGYLAPASLSRRFKQVLAQAELDPIRFHALRHSCATLLLKMRVPGKVVQEILGHSTISIMMDQYGHVLPGMQDEAVAGLDTLLTHGKQKAMVH
jgi:integrase